MISQGNKVSVTLTGEVIKVYEGRALVAFTLPNGSGWTVWVDGKTVHIVDEAPMVSSATEPQIRYIYQLGQSRFLYNREAMDDYCQENYGSIPKGMTIYQASSLINALRILPVAKVVQDTTKPDKRNGGTPPVPQIIESPIVHGAILMPSSVAAEYPTRDQMADEMTNLLAGI